MTITSQDLPAILAAHKKWLDDPDTGKRAKLTGAELTEAELTEADLTGAKLTGAKLTGAKLTGAKLTGANLSWSKLTRADLTWADLTGAKLAGSDLTGANLTRADLTWADLTGAKLAGSDLTRANLTGSNLIVGGNRSDRYAFFAIREPEGPVMIRAGCRYLTISAAIDHWTKTRGDTRLGYESLALVEHLRRMACIAGWIS